MRELVSPLAHQLEQTRTETDSKIESKSKKLTSRQVTHLYHLNHNLARMVIGDRDGVDRSFSILIEKVCLNLNIFSRPWWSLPWQNFGANCKNPNSPMHSRKQWFGSWYRQELASSNKHCFELEVLHFHWNIDYVNSLTKTLSYLDDRIVNLWSKWQYFVALF